VSTASGGLRREARRARELTGAAGELAAYVAGVREAAAQGDAAAAGRLASAESWLAMLRDAGYDSEIAELFLAFAGSDLR
jgi:hypothetical protein